MERHLKSVTNHREVEVKVKVLVIEEDQASVEAVAAEVVAASITTEAVEVGMAAAEMAADPP